MCPSRPWSRATSGARSRVARLLLLPIAVLLVGLWPAVASAYPWMIRHQYTGCAPCHADPSGGGLLTEYGRGQGEILLRTPYGEKVEEPGKAGGFLWGAFTPPDWLLLGGSARAMMVVTKPGGGPSDTRFVQMQTDLKAQVTVGPVRASGTLGYAHQGALPASITQSTQDNLVSREHWIGVDLSDGSFLLRAGRMNLPFGIRNVEHTLWTRSSTRTDSNDAQQHGVALAYSGSWLRGEMMAIAGNFQMGPDEFRERGYSGFLEAEVAPKLTLGLSSLVTYANKDVTLLAENVRQAHGAFIRASPWEKLVLMAEGDALVQSPAGAPTLVGCAAMVQADVEPYQGIHAMLTGELLSHGDVSEPSVGGWLSLAWFFAPHADVRVDGIRQRFVQKTGAVDASTLLVQLHLYL